jgi:hypothetical protein
VSTATAFADAVMTAIAKDKGWAPGPNAGWKRRDPDLGPRRAEDVRTRGDLEQFARPLPDAPDLFTHAVRWPDEIDRIESEGIVGPNGVIWASPAPLVRDRGSGYVVFRADPATGIHGIDRVAPGEEYPEVTFSAIPASRIVRIVRNIDGVNEDEIARWVLSNPSPADLEQLPARLSHWAKLAGRSMVRKDKGWMPGPNAGWKRKDAGPAAAGMPEMGEGFNAWRERLYEGVKRGKYFRDEPAFYRAMSSGEFDAAMEAGEFRPLMGKDLYVTEDPDRLAGGAYGGKDGGYIVQFSPDLETRTAGSRTGVPIEETVVDRASVDDVVAVYRWDPEKQDHIRVPWDGPVQKAGDWAPGPNAMWRRRDRKARVPEHLRDRVTGSLNGINLLIRSEWEAVMKERGLSDDSIARCHSLLQNWGGSESQQKRAAAEIIEHLQQQDEVGRTLQVASQLEEDAWGLWRESHPDEKKLIYRKGPALSHDIESWTTDYEGAWMGNAGHIGWDTQMSSDLEAIHDAGYSILGGVNRSTGAPGEAEITLIRTEVLYPDASVQKAKWAPGPNAQWRRLDEDHELPRCRPPKFEDFVDEAGPADGERLDRAIAMEIEADENGAQPIQWVESGGMEYLGAEWDKEFKALVQERLAERLEANEDFRRMVAASMGVKLEKVDPALVRDRVRELVSTWARTAGDHDVEALLVQEAARQEFGLTNARAKDLKAMADQMLDGWSPGQYDFYRTTLESPAFAGYRAFVRAQYDETQEFLERAGIDEVLVYRGGGIPKGIVPPEGGDEAWGAGYVNVRQNPLTSWSTSATVASDFQVDGSLNQDPAIFATVVPRERILSTPATGNGCLREAEVVILGGETPAFMIAGPDAAWHNFDEVVSDYDIGSLGPHELRPTRITEGAGND